MRASGQHGFKEPGAGHFGVVTLVTNFEAGLALELGDSTGTVTLDFVLDFGRSEAKKKVKHG
ncbi:hypothetical protein [Pseudomonas prosekii]|uniref:hypothetical protein n=1 Tax=Pseudomonas prosekii TaxID=1148509 RepID=UPI0012FE1795|nr:hypothetical protein [Pseudomonas prosekii]